LSACEGKQAPPPPPPAVVLTPASHGCPMLGWTEAMRFRRIRSWRHGWTCAAMATPQLRLEGAWTDGKGIWRCGPMALVERYRWSLRAAVTPGTTRDRVWDRGSWRSMLRAAAIRFSDRRTVSTTTPPLAQPGLLVPRGGLNRSEGDRIVLSIPL
jgi:hypothetical protein